MIHIDVWGLFSVQTHEGYKYFLTIIDDHSRATWIYMLKATFDVLNVFPVFIKMIETQFGKTIKSVRTDNALELSFAALFKEKGIISFHSCPETPQQNSVVERKYQHILNVAIALLFQSNIPLVYWGECIMSAVFLINWIPSHVLNNKSLYQILMNKLPDYHSLRSFGCLCYKSTSPKGRTKFDPRAKACIFLGYPIGYKGYRLLDLETNGISISRHVIFHETIFPFADSSISDTAKAFFSRLAHPDDSVPSVPSSSGESSNPAPSPSDVGLPSATTSRLKKKHLTCKTICAILFILFILSQIFYLIINSLHLIFLL